MKGTIFIAALVAAALGITTPIEARDTIPRTVAEAKEQMAAGERFTSSWPYYRDPPGNVRAEDYAELFGGTVMVSFGYSIETPGDDPVKIIFIGRDGRYEWCRFSSDSGRHKYTASRWAGIKRKLRRTGTTPIFTNGTLGKPVRKYVWLSPLYDGETGETIWYSPQEGAHFWWDWNNGHVQKRLPAATWTLCPDFPSAEELGIGINHKQTAHSYSELLAQDPGRRVLRPDLVTPDPTEPRNAIKRRWLVVSP